MDSSKDIEAEIILRNNTPIGDFDGLTPTEMHNLIYSSFDKNSPVRLNDNIGDSTLDKIPLFRITEEYLKIIQRDKQIKLTPLGALPKKVIVEIYEKRILLDEHIESGLNKLWKEQDWIALMSARLTLELTGIVKKANGKVTLTKKGTELLNKGKRQEIFKQFFQAYTDKFLWGFHDLYPEEPIGQFAWGYSIYLLNKHGDQFRNIEFYGDKYLRAFPDFISLFNEGYSTVRKQFNNCYGVRTFDRFLIRFGLVQLDKQRGLFESDQNEYKKTELLREVFHVDEN